MKKIVIHYPFIASYRVPIFSLLKSSEKYNCELWAGKKSESKFLLTDTKSLNFIDTPFKLINIPIINKKLEWQPSAINRIIKDNMDAYIALGNPNSISTWLCFIIAKTRGIPIFIWSHGYLKEETGIKSLVRNFFYRFATKHLLYGNYAKKIMIKKGFRSEDLHVIYNSLDYNKQKENREKLTYIDRVNIRKKYKISEKSITLITIGRLVKKFKLDQVIESVKNMTERKLDVNLIIIGDGEEKERLCQLVENLGLEDKVTFYGACHEENEISLLYNASDYSVVMGSIGLAAMHSLAYGVPVVTNDNLFKHHPEIEAIIDNETGFYFKENDLNDFISKLKPISYRGHIYTNCINMIEKNYTPTNQKKLIEEALDNLFEGSYDS